MTTWYQAPVSVPFGDANYDKGMGGSHDMDLAEPLDTPITALRSGTIVDISSPPWGKQVGIQLDEPIGGVPYYSFLHLDAVNPALSRGTRLNVGDLVGWSGGENVDPGGRTPAGTPHFLNPPYQSSQPQIGLALMYGQVYGSGKGWANPISSYPELNPAPLLQGGRIPLTSMLSLPGGPSSSPAPTGGVQIPFGGPLIPPSFFYRAGFVLFGSILVFMGLKHFLGSSQISVQIPQNSGESSQNSGESSQTPENKRASARYLKRTSGATVAPPPPGGYT